MSRRRPDRSAGDDGSLRLAIALLVVPPAAWLAQLWSLALLGEIGCRSPGDGGPLGLPVEVAWLAVSTAAAIVAALSGARAIRLQRHLGADARPGRAARATTRGLARMAVWSSLLSVATILLGATGPIFLGCPAGA